MPSVEASPVLEPLSVEASLVPEPAVPLQAAPSMRKGRTERTGMCSPSSKCNARERELRRVACVSLDAPEF